MGDQVTLTDIARESGFSLATVSLALRNKPGISEETRKHIVGIAEILGYAGRASETASKTAIETVGLLMKSEPELPQRGGYFYGQVLVGIEEMCRRSRINLLYATMLVDATNRALEIPLLLANGALEGLLMVGVRIDAALGMLLPRLRAPLILVDAYSESGQYDAVVSDNFQAAYAAVDYLWQRGHQRIALVGGGPKSFPSIAERHRGYRQALFDHGVTEMVVADCELRSAVAFEATRALLKRHPEITAIFGCNDEVAIAVMQAAHEMGIAVPQELSVMGFDDIELAQHVVPALTTLRVDKILMGQTAMQLLLWRLENPDAARVTMIIHAPLMERQSVAARS